MANYIVLEEGRLKLLNAIDFNGLLFDSGTNLPIINPARRDKLSEYDRHKLNGLLERHPTTSILDQFRRARREAYERRVAKRLYEQDNRINKPARDELRSKMNQAFYFTAQLSHDKLVLATAYEEPSAAPIVHKLAKRNYVFGPREIDELCAHATQLIDAGRHELVMFMCESGLIKGRHAVNLVNRLDRSITRDNIASTVDTAQVYYGLQSTDSLKHMAKMFGTGSHLVRFLARRAAWSNRKIENEIRDACKIKPPATDEYDIIRWRERFITQLRHPYKGKTDIFPLYDRMDEVDTWLRANNVAAASITNERIAAIGGTLHYAQAEKNPELAELCMQWRIPEPRFNMGLNIAARTSAQDDIPDVELDGDVAGFPGYHLRKLAKTDPMNMVAANYSDSCGHVGGKVRMVEAMVTEPDVGCYVIERKSDERIVAKLMPWLTEAAADGRRTLVLNAWHDSDATLRQQVTPLLKSLAAALAPREDLNGVHIGKFHSGAQSEFPEVTPLLPRSTITAWQNKDLANQYKIA